jgi:hypothetical protein
MSPLRYVFRRLVSAPTFTTVALLTLALGIGANTAIFSVVNGVLIKPLPYPEPEALVALFHLAPGVRSISGNVNLSPTMSFTYREQNRTFQEMGLWSPGGASVTGIAEPEQVPALMVTHDAAGVRRAAGSGPLVFRGRRHAGFGRNGHAQPRLLAAALRGGIARSWGALSPWIFGLGGSSA